MANRQELLDHWLRDTVGLSHYRIEPASEDASFRRYLRLYRNGETHIVMDAPPAQEDCGPFIAIAGRLLACGLNVPRVLTSDRGNGFVLLTDLGDQLYLDRLEEGNVEALYGDALTALLKIQCAGDAAGLPAYDDCLLRREMALFTDWLLVRHLGIEPDAAQQRGLECIFSNLIQSALAQPTVFVHRDYHSRNLLVTHNNNPGILDFQDAVAGPLSYDLVSLLKDCYVKWPRRRVNQWARQYCQWLNASGAIEKVDECEFQRWFDLMGVQRHLKASGIFARLYHRDGKPGFLKDIPRTLSYILDLEQDYPELTALCRLIDDLIMPRLQPGDSGCMP
ncbi:MAG: aminoglycoside phosphotransferase [Gammaproteobacteria bacterium RBG_16_51_14]|nr:MAG: aminoglycoside phosphotransferase [Gammaproteobacteria bacterium RBG_16_51_14]